MNKTGKIITVIILIAAVAAAVALRQRNTSKAKPEPSPQNALANLQDEPTRQSLPGNNNASALPRLLDLGADKCVPCKMMAPILEELKTEYAGRLEVQFIDVWKVPEEAKPYGIRVIPTQIFFDAAGKELFRHEGFMSKQDILARWQGLGVRLAKQE